MRAWSATWNFLIIQHENGTLMREQSESWKHWIHQSTLPKSNMSKSNNCLSRRNFLEQIILNLCYLPLVSRISPKSNRFLWSQEIRLRQSYLYICKLFNLFCPRFSRTCLDIKPFHKFQSNLGIDDIPSHI